MKKFVIGDTHGCFREFKALLDLLPIDLETDQLIMLGDYIDRGYESYEMVQAIKALRTRYGSDHVILLRGNHEQMAIDSYKDKSHYWSNGCRETLDSFKRNHFSLDQAVNFFESLPLFYEDKDFIFVHGGMKPGTSMKFQLESDLLWIRDEFIFSSISMTKPVIFGHTPTTHINNTDYPIFFKSKIALDTACVYGHALSALELQDGTVTNIYQVNRKAA